MIGAALIFGGILKFYPQTAVLPTAKVESFNAALGGINLKLDISDTEALREQGLSGRSGLADNTGMLFKFDKSGIYGFWMKDMKFSIDMVWILKNKVVFIEKNVAPESYPKVFYPSGSADAVVELPAGFSLAHGLKVGSVLTLF